MKKICCILMMVFTCFGCTAQSVVEESKRADVSAYELLTDKEHNFQTSTFEEVLGMMKNQGSGTFYIGYGDCAWCQEAVPVLNEVAKEQKEKIHYISLYDKAGNALFEMDDYKAFVKKVVNKLDTDDKGKPTLYVPFVFVIENGKLVESHISTVDGHNAKTSKMSKKQAKELKEIYTKMME